jgi:hypothetical protein
MDWKKERDLLIAQTMAFVQSVAGQKPDAEPSIAAKLNIRPNLEATPDVETAPLEAAKMRAEEIPGPPATPPGDVPVTIQVPRMIVAGDVRSEIQARVADFRAHQQRFNRERAEYFNATLTKLRAAIENDSVADPSDRTPPRR